MIKIKFFLGGFMMRNGINKVVVQKILVGFLLVIVFTSLNAAYSTTVISKLMNDFQRTYKNISKTSGRVVTTVRQKVVIVCAINLGIQKQISNMKERIRSSFPPVQESLDLNVRVGTDLSSSEYTFIHNRMPKIQESLYKNFGIQEPLKIAFCCSGGGNRAMLVSLGYMLGAQDIGLFDTALYIAGLSGSTWTITPWSYLHATQGISLEEFKDQLVGRLYKTIGTIGGLSLVPMVTNEQKKILLNNMVQRFGYDQTVSSIDFYGGLIGNYTLLSAGRDRLNATWSSIADIIEQGNMPLPMGSAVSYKYGQSIRGLTDYYWFEISPFEVGSDQLNSYVPIKKFGSKFNKGNPVDGYLGNAPEYPMSFYQGVFGSAFAFSMNEIIDKAIGRPKITLLGRTFKLPVDLWIRQSTFEHMRNIRFMPAMFHNYSYGLSESPIATSKYIALYDGAMNFNFPLPIVMRPARQVDVIFICDASADFEELKVAERHCKKNNIKFPSLKNIIHKDAVTKPMTVLNDPRLNDYDKDVITIVYCPFVKNSNFSEKFDPVSCISQSFCNTFNFKYEKSQAETVVDLARYNINSVKNDIVAVMKSLADSKKVPVSVVDVVDIKVDQQDKALPKTDSSVWSFLF